MQRASCQRSGHAYSPHYSPRRTRGDSDRGPALRSPLKADAFLFGNINAAIRSGDRKRAEAEAYAVAIGHGAPYGVHQCWIVRATRRNRELLARYPEIYATRFRGSSRAWVDALTKGTPPPVDTGLVWTDLSSTRIFEWRPRRNR